MTFFLTNFANMKKRNLIFIYPHLHSFIQTEIKLLRTEFNLIYLSQNWYSKILVPINLIIQFIFILKNIKKADLILISFGGYWSFLPSLIGKIFNKKVAIIVHGTDCIAFHEIKYGNLRSIILRYVIRKSFQWANIILPVSKSLTFTENNYYSNSTIKLGYLYHLNEITTPYKVIHNGLIIENWERENIIRDKKSFITVISSHNQFVRKGIDLILNVAKKLPDCKFYIAGINNVEYTKCNGNIIHLGRLTPDELKKWYSKTQFYLQLSVFEGFGVALCEAMLCNCIPIVSNVNFLPSIIGKSGFILDKRNSDKLYNLIKTALKSDISILESKARERIIKYFPISKRKKILTEVLNDNSKNNHPIKDKSKANKLMKSLNLFQQNEAQT